MDRMMKAKQIDYIATMIDDIKYPDDIDLNDVITIVDKLNDLADELAQDKLWRLNIDEKTL